MDQQPNASQQSVNDQAIHISFEAALAARDILHFSMRRMDRTGRSHKAQQLDRHLGEIQRAIDQYRKVHGGRTQHPSYQVA